MIGLLVSVSNFVSLTQEKKEQYIASDRPVSKPVQLCFTNPRKKKNNILQVIGLLVSVSNFVSLTQEKKEQYIPSDRSVSKPVQLCFANPRKKENNIF